MKEIYNANPRSKAMVKHKAIIRGQAMVWDGVWLPDPDVEPEPTEPVRCMDCGGTNIDEETCVDCLREALM